MVLLLATGLRSEGWPGEAGQTPGGRRRPGLGRKALTDALEQPLGLSTPPDPEEVDGQAAEDDGEADAALHGVFQRRRRSGRGRPG